MTPFHAALFEWLTPFIASLFEWLSRLNACGVFMAKAVSRFAVSVAKAVLRCKFYVVLMRKKYINICSSENYVYFCGIVMAITVMLFTKK